jgi:PAS domain S-box-containing protein
LLRSEAYLAAGQRISHTGTCTWNAQTGELLWSQEHCRIFGVNPDQMKQPYEIFLNRVHPEDRAFVKTSVGRAVQQKTAFDIEYRIVHPDRGIRNIHASGQPISNEFVEYLGTVMDITERKKAEEELRRSEAYLAESERLSHTGSWAWNVSTGELFWSKEHFRILGLDPSSKTPSVTEALHIIHPQDRSYVQQALEKALRNRSDFEADCRVVRPDGTIRYIHSR